MSVKQGEADCELTSTTFVFGMFVAPNSLFLLIWPPVLWGSVALILNAVGRRVHELRFLLAFLCTLSNFLSAFVQSCRGNDEPCKAVDK